MKIKYRVLAMALALIICLMCSGCGNEGRTETTATKAYSGFASPLEELEESTSLENESFAVSWDDKSKQISFTDKASGRVYCSCPEKSNIAIMKSPIIISYYSPSTFTDTNAFSSTEAIETDSVYAERIDGGFRVYYDFINLEKAVPVEYTIAEDCFKISVNPQELYDSGDNYITGVSIAPFMCSVKNDAEDSYLFYPDGSGTLLSNSNINKIGDRGSKRVYGEDMLISKFDLTSYSRQLNLPVFGAKSGDNAIFGIITEGAELSYLNWDVGSSNIGYSAIYPHFKIRGYNLVNPPARFANTKAHIQVFDSYITGSRIEVSYYTLSGENANYSGMANLYRDYLKNSGALRKSEEQASSVSLKIIGGINKKSFTFGIPHTVLHPLTSLNRAKEILEYFSSDSASITANLVGFGKSGLDMGLLSGGFEIGSALGSKKDARKLSEYAEKNGISLFMDFDTVAFSESGGGFSAMDDSAKLPSGKTAYLYFPDDITRNFDSTERYMLLRRSRLEAAAQKAANTADKYGFSGVSLSSLSSVCYADYSQNGAELGGGMAEDVSEILKKITREIRVAVSAANGYAAGSSDYIYDTPLSSSKYNISKFDVPFYQMVFRGNIPLGSEAVNLAVNRQKLLLQCAEAGIAPSYALIGEYDNTAVGAKYSALYGAAFEGIKEEIKKTAAEFEKLLSPIKNSEIIKHTVLDNGLRIAEYDNGCVVAVNFSEIPQSFSGREIGGMDYAVLEAQR